MSADKSETTSENTQDSRVWLGVRRFLVALLIGLAGCVFIWLVTPYNDFILRNSMMSETYLPISVVAILFIIILCVNPILLKIGRKWALSYRQMALIFAILLVGSAPASSGLLRFLPYAIAGETKNASEIRARADDYEAADLPPSLFPGKIGYKEDVPAAKYFINKLPRGKSIPWGVWVKPLIAWGFFVGSMWMMMIGLAGVVFPQWRNNERLAFPLLMIQQSLIETPEEGHFLPKIFRSRPFWIAAGIVFCLHLMQGLHLQFPQRVPEIRLQWNITNVFSEQPFVYLPEYIKTSKIFFILIGVAFFMSNRVAFSLWFFPVAYGIYKMVDEAYAPPYSSYVPEYHRTGAMIAMTIGLLWLGRAHWAKVFRTIVSGCKSDDDHRNRTAGAMFLLGLTGMVAWFWWVGGSLGAAMLFAAILFMYAILVTRIVAETGLIIMGFYPDNILAMIRMFPVKWFSASSAWLGGVTASFGSGPSYTSCAVLTTHAIGLDEDAKPRYHSRLAVLFLIICLLALVICGAAHLYINYHYSKSLDGFDQPVSPWGVNNFWSARGLLNNQQQGKWYRATDIPHVHTAVGMGIAGTLQWLCLAMPKFPIHPIGMLIMNTWFATMVWSSVMVGWALKLLIVNLGGSRLYAKARPFFIGLILGEVFAAVFWAILQAILMRMGYVFEVLKIYPN